MKELPMLPEDEVKRMAFILGTENYIDGRFRAKAKEEEKKDCERIEKLANKINFLQQMEANGFYIEEGKKQRVCRCSNCSHSRQNDADFWLDELNSISEKYKDHKRIETFRRPNSKIWELKLVVPREGD